MRTEYLSFRAASNRFNIPLRNIENYAVIGEELPYYTSGNRRYLRTSDIQKWLSNRRNYLFKLGRRDYLKCLDFAIRSYYAERPKSNFGTTEQRDAGKIISNYVLGKLGEMAIQKFLKNNFQVDSRLDFDLRDAIVGQDISEIAKPRKGGRVYNPPRLNVAIKSSKMKNVFLIVSAKEVKDKNRKSDVYIFVRVDLYLNHLLRIMKSNKPLSKFRRLIPEFIAIDAEVCGYCKHSTLRKSRVVSILPNSNTKIQPSYIMKTGDLSNRWPDWTRLMNKL